MTNIYNKICNIYTKQNEKRKKNVIFIEIFVELNFIYISKWNLNKDALRRYGHQIAPAHDGSRLVIILYLSHMVGSLNYEPLYYIYTLLNVSFKLESGIGENLNKQIKNVKKVIENNINSLKQTNINHSFLQ